MKAFEILKEKLRANMNPGSSWLDGAKRWKLTIYKGQLKPRKWYFSSSTSHNLRNGRT